VKTDPLWGRQVRVLATEERIATLNKIRNLVICADDEIRSRLTALSVAPADGRHGRASTTPGGLGALLDAVRDPHAGSACRAHALT
jgi:hypothetical protein